MLNHMRHAKLITGGILLLTCLCVNELQQTIFLKIASAGDKIRQNEWVSLLWQEDVEYSSPLLDPYPQASALSIIEKVASKLISVTKQEIAKLQ